MVKDLRTVVESDPKYPAILFVYMGTVDDGATFFAKTWPEARAVSDPNLELYRVFGLGRGNLMEVMGPGPTTCTFRAIAKGHAPGKPIGDPWQMPGLFLVRGQQVLWSHDFAHIGDHPDFAALPQQWQSVIAVPEG